MSKGLKILNMVGDLMSKSAKKAASRKIPEDGDKPEELKEGAAEEKAEMKAHASDADGKDPKVEAAIHAKLGKGKQKFAKDGGEEETKMSHQPGSKSAKIRGYR